MDYRQLLQKAQQNERNSANQDVPCYKTGFSPPKKLQRNVSSANIQKFLARKENEEKLKMVEAQKKKQELLALRNQDKKAKRRVECMLKRTKSANYSVMEDAIDNNNTAATLDGPMQCDEDDYGYVSQEASALYAKIMNKYSNAPPEPAPFSKMKKEVKDLSAAKDRVRAALRKEEDEADLPHKRKRKHKEGDAELANEDTQEKIKEESHPKEKSKDKLKSQDAVRKKINNAPPPPSFDQILKMAEEKKGQPVDLERMKRITIQKEPDRPMTQREKVEWQREQERLVNRERREQGLPPIPSKFEDVKKPKPGNSTNKVAKTPNGQKIQSNEKPVNGQPVTANPKQTNPVKRIDSELTRKGEQQKAQIHEKSKVRKVEDKSKYSDKKSSNKQETSRVNEDSATLDDIDREIELLRRKRLLLEKNKIKAPETNKPLSGSDRQTKPRPSAVPNKQLKPKVPQDRAKASDSLKSRPQPSPDKHRPSGPSHNGPKLASASQVTRPSYLPPTKPKGKPSTKFRRTIDSESEYDSELDDFIEDEDDSKEDYSSYIKEIFGYDKSRYANVDDDDECMESNFAQQMKEEFVSTKIGIMEDLEDIKKEQEEKKRLKARKMKMKGF